MENGAKKKHSTGKHARVSARLFGANLSEQSICRSICYCYLSKAKIETQLIHEYLINHP